jgi:ubiquinone/menaquinone biosynthesis C-methylase UbiE
LERSTGFTDVDASGRSGALVDYLALLAQRLAGFREEGYALLELQPGQAVLDVGCGAGEVCAELARRVGPRGRVTGVDRSEAMIEAARAAMPATTAPIELKVASIYQLPFADASFDAVRAERVFQHLQDPEAGLREMVRVTRSGGRVMLIDPDHGQSSIALDDPSHRRVFEAMRRAMLRMIVNPHSGVRLRPMMMRAGLAQVRQHVQFLEVAYADWRRAFFADDQLAAAQAAGEITGPEARSFLEALQQRDRAALFFANALGYNVVGVKA